MNLKLIVRSVNRLKEMRGFKGTQVLSSVIIYSLILKINVGFVNCLDIWVSEDGPNEGFYEVSSRIIHVDEGMGGK